MFQGTSLHSSSFKKKKKKIENTTNVPIVLPVSVFSIEENNISRRFFSPAMSKYVRQITQYV